MDILKKIHPAWALRIGLGTMYLYSGYDLFYHPTSWIWAVPKWYAYIVTSVFSLEMYLRFQGIMELVIGLLFIAWFFGTWGVRVGAIFATVEFLFILIFVGVDLITFRDIGLLGAALALLIMTTHRDFPKETFGGVTQSIK